METRKTQVAVPVLLAIMTLMVSRVVFAGKDSLHERHMAELQAVKASLVRRNLPGFVSPPPTPPQVKYYNILYHKSSYSLSICSKRFCHYSFLVW